MRLTKEGSTYDINPEMERYIVACLKTIQGDKCACCKDDLSDFQIHHKRYGENINLYDLELLNKKCHGKTHGTKPKGLGRKS